eukprot:jgi/Psemu1/289981/fgenesh1_pg.433_\
MSRSEEALSIDYGDDGTFESDSDDNTEEPVEDFYNVRHGVVQASRSFGDGENMEIVFDGDSHSHSHKHTSNFNYTEDEIRSRKSSRNKPPPPTAWDKLMQKKLMIGVALVALIVIIAVPVALSKDKGESSKLESNKASSKGKEAEHTGLFEDFDAGLSIADTPTVTTIKAEEITTIPPQPETEIEIETEIELIDVDDDSQFNSTVAPTDGGTDGETNSGTNGGTSGGTDGGSDKWWQTGEDSGDDDGSESTSTSTSTSVPTSYWWQNTDSTATGLIDQLVNNNDEATSASTTWLPTTFPTAAATPSPTASPTTKAPSPMPTIHDLFADVKEQEETSTTVSPVASPTLNPTKVPTASPTDSPTSSPTSSPSWEPWPSVEVTVYPTWSPTTWQPTITAAPTKNIDYPFFFPHLSTNDNGNDSNLKEQQASDESNVMLADMAATKGPGPEAEDEIMDDAARRAEVELDKNGDVVKNHSLFGPR